jgi:uncharacterized protein YbbC (DUF1343 family)
VLDRSKYRPVLTAVAILAAIRDLYPDEVLWRDPPYEYETVKLPIDILWGSPVLRQMLSRGASPREIEASWQEELAAFARVRERYLLYRARGG